MDALVSVIIPTYNRSAKLVRAIESVLRQTYNNLEIIVVDDGSTDDTKDVISHFKGLVKYHFQENQGVSAARNIGITLSKGLYVAFLDSDDEWLPEKIAKQLAVFDENSDVGLVLCDCIYVDPTHAEVGRTRRRNDFPEDGYILQDVLLRPLLIPSTALVKKKVFEKVGNFDTALVTAEDIDIFLRIAENENIHLIDEALILYMRGNNGLGDSISSYDDFLFVIKRFLSTTSAVVSKNVKKKCLYNCYYSFVRGKVWQKGYFDAAKGVLSLLKSASTVPEYITSMKLGFNVLVHYFWNKCK